MFRIISFLFCSVFLNLTEPFYQRVLFLALFFSLFYLNKIHSILTCPCHNPPSCFSFSQIVSIYFFSCPPLHLPPPLPPPPSSFMLSLLWTQPHQPGNTASTLLRLVLRDLQALVPFQVDQQQLIDRLGLLHWGRGKATRFMNLCRYRRGKRGHWTRPHNKRCQQDPPPRPRGCGEPTNGPPAPPGLCSLPSERQAVAHCKLVPGSCLTRLHRETEAAVRPVGPLLGLLPFLDFGPMVNVAPRSTAVGHEFEIH